jgi:hypothetical protein
MGDSKDQPQRQVFSIIDDEKSSGFFISISELCSLPQEELLFDKYLLWGKIDLVK